MIPGVLRWKQFLHLALRRSRILPIILQKPAVGQYIHEFLSVAKNREWLNEIIKPFGSFRTSEGSSNYPTFTGDREFTYVSYMYRHGKGVREGDMVCLRNPNNKNHAFEKKNGVNSDLSKRVAGLEGTHGYMKTVWKGVPQQRVMVPQWHCWVLGDNASNSRDSRLFRPVPLTDIKGKILWRWGPEGSNEVFHGTKEERMRASQGAPSPSSDIGKLEEASKGSSPQRKPVVSFSMCGKSARKPASKQPLKAASERTKQEGYNSTGNKSTSAANELKHKHSSRQ